MEQGPQMHARLRAAPILKMVGVSALVAAIIVAIYAALRSQPSYETIASDSPWILSDLVHLPQFLVPFALICWLTSGRPASYGFNARQKPPIFTHARMLGLGVVFGLLMSARYIPTLVDGRPLDIPQPTTTVNVVGNMTFQWIVVGLSEETMFRGLIQTYLMNSLTGHIAFLGHSLHIGTVIGAVIWGLFHFINILIMPAAPVALIVVFTTFAGLLMGYAYQETGSLLTTTIVHNTIFGVPLTIGYILDWLL